MKTVLKIGKKKKITHFTEVLLLGKARVHRLKTALVNTNLTTR